jgi:NodT family efflux transporter outer membrane factor (OMF) lipoprotein
MHGEHETRQRMHGGVRAVFSVASLLGVLSVSSGCTVGPKYTRPDVPLAEEWSTERDPKLTPRSEADSLWWKAFNDPALDRLVEVAYQQNLPLQVAGLRIVEARALLAVAKGRQYPQFQALSGTFTAQGIPKQVADYTRLDRNFLTYSLGFDAAWEIDVWGKYRRGIEAQDANLTATVADYYAGIVSLSAEVARTYTIIRTYEVLITLAEENARVQEEGLKIAESRYQNGATSELDATQAKTLLESTRASIPRLHIGLQQSRNALSILLGQPVGSVDALLSGGGQIPNAPTNVAVSVPAEMLRRRPDIRSAELQAEAQCARIGIAKTDLYPRFVLAGSVGLQAFTTGQASHNLFSTESFTYSAGPRFFWPVLNYGRLENSVRVQDAVFQQLLVNYRNTVLNAAREVEDALVAFTNTQRSRDFEQESVKAAQRSVEIALTQYREGAVDFQRVIDAQRALLDAQNRLAQTTSDVVTSLIALYKALGGGWESRQGNPIVPEAMQKEMKQRTNWSDDLLSSPGTIEAKQNPPAEKH